MAKTVTTPRALVRNTFFNLLMLMSNAVVAFFLIPFFIGQLGKDSYGVWYLIGDIFRYRILLGMGLNSAINRRIPMYMAKDDEDGIRRTVSTALFFFTIIAIVLAILTLILAAKVGDWFAIPPELVRAAGGLVLVVGLSFAVSTPLQLTTAVLSGLQRYDMVSIVTIVVLAIRTVVTVVLLLRGYGLITLGLIYGLSEVVARGVQHILARRLLPAGYISWQNVDRGLLKEMLFYGMNTFLYAMGTLILCRASTTIIGIFLPPEQITIFSNPTVSVLLLSEFLQAFTAAIKPAVSDLDARDNHSGVKLIAFLTQKYSLLVLIPAAAFLIVMGREFLTVWVGDKFDEPTIRSMVHILTILTVGYCMVLSQHSNFLVLAGRGEHRVFGILMAVEAVLCIGAAVFSVGVLHWGLAGVAWSNLVPMALVAGIIIPVYFHHKMNIRAGESLSQVWRPAVLSTAPSIVLIVAWKRLAPPDSWLALFAVVGAAALVTAVSAWLFGMGDIERQRLRSVLKRIH
ncbi:MAG TPA: oligosaccharide flippase family protein [Sedimentisphaerales bacterium]|jgi:O-antigen/teichoic acid export membrane protein|nr:oligosaccharide flippase family protein [Sedimentisphaerales bacterium]HNU31200.1 oligosaccharide flippase family protein [Sedimentisphaerales bacterium]